MNDYLMLQLSADKRSDFEHSRTRDRLSQIVRCCRPSAVRRWLRAWQPARAAACCA